MCPKLCGKRFHSGTANTADFGAHLGEDFVDARALRRVVLRVQAEIEQREFELAHRREPGLEGARAQQLRLLVRRQRRAGLEDGAPSSASTSGCQAKFSRNWLGSSTASHDTPLMPAIDG